jgi:signal transduction histidine kinase
VRALSRRLLASVRVRVTATALLAVGCALGVAAFVINADLQHNRNRVLTETAQQDTREVLAFNPTLSAPLILPPDATVDSGLVQVIEGNKVVAASRVLRREGPLWDPGDPSVFPLTGPLAGSSKDVEVVSVPVTAGSVKASVVVVLSMEQYDHTVATVRRLLELGTPMLLVVVGFICWLIVGRALRPIERMRREVDDVATVRASAHHRVAEPGHDDEVGRLARTLNSMLDRMEESAARERRFVADASHELRSPIANIRTELEVALLHPGVTDWQQVAGEVYDQNVRMERLVAGLLLLARSDEGSLIEATEPTDLSEVAVQVIDDLAPGGVPVVLHSRPVRVRVPEVYAERMVTNLVDNARRFAATAVHVTVSLSVEPAGTFAVVTVADDGPGVPVADRQRIFERFVRLDEARNRGEGGFGLGLAIVSDLSRFYGGTIEVGAGGPGAEFILRLPAAPTHFPQPVTVL